MNILNGYMNSSTTVCVTDILFFYIYRPLEVERHPDGSAAGDRGVIGSDDVGLSGTKGAGRLCGDDILRVFQANSEKNVTVPVSSTDPLRGVEGMNLQLKHTRGQNL